MAENPNITEMLQRVSAGQPEAMDELLPVVYEHLRVLARRRLNQEYNANTLATTGLVHEAYLKLVRKPDQVDWQNRNHFYAVASRAMRQVLVNRAHARRALKRGAGAERVSIDEANLMSDDRADELIALDDALTKLSLKNQRISRIVDLRYFGGFTIEECAEIMDLSVSTVNREWRLARLWLFDWLSSED